MKLTIDIPNDELPEMFQGVEGKQNVIDQIAWCVEVARDRLDDFMAKGNSQDALRRNAMEEALRSELTLAKLLLKNLRIDPT